MVCPCSKRSVLMAAVRAAQKVKRLGTIDVKCRSHSLRPAADCHNSGAGDLDQAERQHEPDESLDFFACAGDLEHEALGRGIDDARAERIGKTQRLHAMLDLAAHLDHDKLA